MWKFYGRHNIEDLGYIPQFINETDARPVREQLHESYLHGGGWNPFKGFKFHDGDWPHISYPGDPDFRAIAETTIHGQRLIVFSHDWVGLVQPDGSLEISRMD